MSTERDELTALLSSTDPRVTGWCEKTADALLAHGYARGGAGRPLTAMDIQEAEQEATRQAAPRSNAWDTRMALLLNVRAALSSNESPKAPKP